MRTVKTFAGKSRTHTHTYTHTRTHTHTHQMRVEFVHGNAEVPTPKKSMAQVFGGQSQLFAFQVSRQQHHLPSAVRMIMGIRQLMTSAPPLPIYQISCNISPPLTLARTLLSAGMEQITYRTSFFRTVCKLGVLLHGQRLISGSSGTLFTALGPTVWHSAQCLVHVCRLS